MNLRMGIYSTNTKINMNIILTFLPFHLFFFLFHFMRVGYFSSCLIGKNHGENSKEKIEKSLSYRYSNVI